METTNTTKDILDNLAGAAALAMGDLLVIRIIKKQSLAAEIRQSNPTMSFHDSIVSAYHRLGYNNPFKI